MSLSLLYYLTCIYMHSLFIAVIPNNESWRNQKVTDVPENSSSRRSLAAAVEIITNILLIFLFHLLFHSVTMAATQLPIPEVGQPKGHAPQSKPKLYILDYGAGNVRRSVRLSHIYLRDNADRERTVWQTLSISLDMSLNGSRMRATLTRLK